MRQRPRGEIKFTPNSFTVQEIISVGQRQVVVPLHRETLVHGRDGSAPVTLFHLTKTGWTTEQAVREVARQMQVNERSISNYGLKDRYAHTSQRIGIKGDFHPEFDHKEIFLRQVGISQHPLRPGGNVGNRFCIEVLSAARDIDQNLFSKVPNFFGLQRVSSREDGEIGRLLLEGDFEGAARMLSSRYSAYRKLRNAYTQKKEWKEAWIHPAMRFDMSFKMLKWQSWLWNQLLQQILDDPQIPERLPMWHPNHVELYRHIWSPANVNPDSLLYLQHFGRLTEVQPQNIAVEQLLIGWRVSFDLPSGAYATVTLSQAFELIERHR